MDYVLQNRAETSSTASVLVYTRRFVPAQVCMHSGILRRRGLLLLDYCFGPVCTYGP